MIVEVRTTGCILASREAEKDRLASMEIGGEGFISWDIPPTIWMVKCVCVCVCVCVCGICELVAQSCPTLRPHGL